MLNEAVFLGSSTLGIIRRNSSLYLELNDSFLLVTIICDITLDESCNHEGNIRNKSKITSAAVRRAVTSTVTYLSRRLTLKCLKDRQTIRVTNRETATIRRCYVGYPRDYIFAHMYAQRRQERTIRSRRWTHRGESAGIKAPLSGCAL